jgi:hypothetical protein
MPNEDACKQIRRAENTISMQYLSRQIGVTLSSYTKAINKQNDTYGNLFQKKTKAKCLKSGYHESLIVDSSKSALDYITTCFFYIHQNPVKAGLIKKIEDWPYSSWRDFAGLRSGSMCNQEKLFQLTGLSKNDCIDQNKFLNENYIEKVF